MTNLQTDKLVARESVADWLDRYQQGCPTRDAMLTIKHLYAALDAETEQCCRDVCPLCEQAAGGIGVPSATRVGGGNWRWVHLTHNFTELCKASPIKERVHQEVLGEDKS